MIHSYTPEQIVKYPWKAENAHDLSCVKEGATREKESGRLHWPDVSQDLRHQGSRFCFGLVCNCADC